MGKLIFFSAPGVRGLSPDRGVSLWDGKIYSVFLDFLGVYFLDGETNFIFFLRSESPPGSATMGSEFDVP